MRLPFFAGAFLLLFAPHQCLAGADQSVEQLFSKQSKFLEARVKSGMVSEDVLPVWAELTHRAIDTGQLLNFRQFTDFLRKHSAGLSGRDKANILGLYRQVQRVPPNWTDHYRSFQAQSQVIAVTPIAYDYSIERIDGTGAKVRFQIDVSHDGKNVVSEGRSYRNDALYGYGIFAADSVRYMRFSDEGKNADAAIVIPSEVRAAEIMPFHGYSGMFRKRDPLLLLHPAAFQRSYDFSPSWSAISELQEVMVWEEAIEINGVQCFVVGTSGRYAAFSTENGDLIFRSQGGDRVAAFRDSKTPVNTVSYSDYYESPIGRIPRAISVSIDRTRYNVELASIEVSSSRLGEECVERAIPVNAYVLDRIREVKWINYDEGANAPGIAPKSGGTDWINKILAANIVVALVLFAFLILKKKASQA